MDIVISVANRVATPPSNAVIVCGNSEYNIVFDFDTEWQEETSKTARFVWFVKNKAYSKEIPFEGDTVAVPILSNANAVHVGVYAGNLRTTTPAKIVCERSILCYGSDGETAPDSLAQIKGQIAELAKALEDIEFDPAEISRMVEEYLVKNPVKESDPTVPAWAKQATKPKYTAKEVGAVASSELSGEVNDALAKAKASGEFDGKSAYEYARDGGYAGTEAEFAAKLATGDDSRFFPVTITDNGDGTYTSDHYWSDIEAAYESGRIPIAVMVKNVYHLVYAGVSMNGYRFSRQEGAVLTTITVKKADVSVATTTLATPDDIPDINQKPFFLFTAEEVNEDGTIAVDGGIIGMPGTPDAEVINDVTVAMEKLTEAYLQGRVCFLIVQAGDFASTVLPCATATGDIMTFSITEGVADLFADVREGVVALSYWEMPSTLPNPNALIIGDVTYDGSATVDMTVKINALIDTKLGVIENGTY